MHGPYTAGSATRCPALASRNSASRVATVWPAGSDIRRLRQRIACRAAAIRERGDGADRALARRMLREPIEPAVGDLGIAVQNDGIAVAVQAQRPIDGGGETAARGLLQQCQQTALGQRAQTGDELGFGRRVVDDDQLEGGVRSSREHALEAPDGRLGAAVDRHDDVDGCHDVPVMRARRRPSGQRSQPASVSRYASRCRASPSAASRWASVSLCCANAWASLHGLRLQQRDARAKFGRLLPLARQRIDRSDELAQAILGNLARVELVPGQRLVAPQRPDIVAEQRLRAVVEQRDLRQRGQRHRGGRADDQKIHRRRRLGRLHDAVIGQREERRAPRGACRRILGPQRRVRDDPLRVPPLRRKPGRQQRLQLVARQLLDVEFVLERLLAGIDGLVRRRDDEHAAGGEHAPEFGEHRRLFGKVLDRLERDDEVDAGVG